MYSSRVEKGICEAPQKTNHPPQIFDALAIVLGLVAHGSVLAQFDLHLGLKVLLLLLQSPQLLSQAAACALSFL